MSSTKQGLGTLPTSSTPNVASREVSSEDTYRRERVEDTPFDIVTDEEGSYIMLGRYRISEIVAAQNKGELEKQIENRDWQLIFNAANIIAKHAVGEYNEFINQSKNG